MNTIPCEIIEDLLPSYKDNLLSESVNEAVTYHLEHCPKCAAKLDALEKFFIEEDFVFEFRQKRRHNALRLGYFRCFVSADQCEENV